MTRERAPGPGRGEFIALMAMLSATIALSIDAMLPVLPEIGAAISPDSPDQGNLVLPAFMAGLGLGTFMSGPLADAFGRRRVILWGYGIYIIAGLICTLAQSLEVMLLARALQGLGAAGPRVATMAIIRDRYAGREMAQVTSLVMIVFMLVPALAPAIGAGISWAFGWRAIFFAFVLFALIMGLWFYIRQPETLSAEKRRRIELPLLWKAAVEIMSLGPVRNAIIAQAFVFGALVLSLVTIHSVYDQTYDKGASFPFWFGLIALISGVASFTNSRLVMRLGMLRLIRYALIGLICLSTVLFVDAFVMEDAPPFWLFLIWQAGLFSSIGFTVGNYNAVALAPLGHIAGFGSSFIQASSTVGGVTIATALSSLTYAQPGAFAAWVAVLSAMSLWLTRYIPEPKVG